jgi:hypothetical protein
MVIARSENGDVTTAGHDIATVEGARVGVITRNRYALAGARFARIAGRARVSVVARALRRFVYASELRVTAIGRAHVFVRTLFLTVDRLLLAAVHHLVAHAVTARIIEGGAVARLAFTASRGADLVDNTVELVRAGASVVDRPVGYALTVLRVAHAKRASMVQI